MRQVAANRDHTVVIVLPEAHPAARSSSSVGVKSLETQPLPTEPPDDSNETHPFASDSYYELNSSSDTIPETDATDRPSAFPPLNIIKAGAHKHTETPDQELDSKDNNQQRHVARLEDTVADLNIDFNVAYTNAHQSSSRPFVAAEDLPNRRFLSTRAGLAKSRVKAETDALRSSTPSPTAKHLDQNNSPLLDSSPGRSGLRRATPSFNNQVSTSSSTSSLLESPPSLFNNSQTSSKNLSDSFEQPLNPAHFKKRKAQAGQRPGLAYAKRVKHTPHQKLAVPMDTMVIPSSPEKSDDEEPYSPRTTNTGVHVVLPSSPPPHTPTLDNSHDYPRQLEIATASLRHQLSFHEPEPADVKLYNLDYSAPANLQNDQDVNIEVTSTNETARILIAKNHFSEQVEVTSSSLVVQVAHVETSLPAGPAGDPMEVDTLTTPKATSKACITEIFLSPPDPSPPTSPRLLSRFSPGRLLSRKKKMKIDSGATASPSPPESSAVPRSPGSTPIKGPVLRSAFSKLTRLDSLQEYLRNRKV